MIGLRHCFGLHLQQFFSNSLRVEGELASFCEDTFIQVESHWVRLPQEVVAHLWQLHDPPNLDLLALLFLFLYVIHFILILILIFIGLLLVLGFACRLLLQAGDGVVQGVGLGS